MFHADSAAMNEWTGPLLTNQFSRKVASPFLNDSLSLCVQTVEGSKVCHLYLKCLCFPAEHQYEMQILTLHQFYNSLLFSKYQYMTLKQDT